MVALTLLILKIFVCSEMPKNIARSVSGGHGGRGGAAAARGQVSPRQAAVTEREEMLRDVRVRAF